MPSCSALLILTNNLTNNKQQYIRSSATVLNHDHSISFIGDCTLVAMTLPEATEAEADADAEAEIEADADAKD